MKNDIAVIGLATMGKNLVLNLSDHQFRVAVFNRTTQVTTDFIKEEPRENIFPYYELEELVASLAVPRKILLMIKSGPSIDLLLEKLIPLLQKGDIIMDGGNSFFQDTNRRYEYLQSKEIEYLGVGISGGELGARFGPAIMPGGSATAYAQVQAILEAISAKVNGDVCCQYTSTKGAGHFVKMVHNGIEYGDMQLIAESFSLLQHFLPREEVANTFSQFQEGKLESYLIDITGKILRVKDPETNNYLLDMVLDKSGQKGTGAWTSLEAIKLQVDVSILTAALNARYNSTLKDLRLRISDHLNLPTTSVPQPQNLTSMVENALYLAKVLTYTQGFALLKAAQEEYGYDFDLQNIARIFRGGCIIQARFLQEIIRAYQTNPQLHNLILDPQIAQIIREHEDDLRQVVILSQSLKLAIPSFSSALAYLDTLTTKHSNSSLIQAQRDYFGAHTVQRTDRDPAQSFHYDWDKYE